MKLKIWVQKQSFYCIYEIIWQHLIQINVSIYSIKLGKYFFLFYILNSRFFSKVYVFKWNLNCCPSYIKLIWTCLRFQFGFLRCSSNLKSHVKKENSYWPRSWTLISRGAGWRWREVGWCSLFGSENRGVWSPKFMDNKWWWWCECKTNMHTKMFNI